MYREVIEVEKCLGNYNGEIGWKISKTWLLIIHQEKRKHEIKEDGIEEAKNVTNKNC